MEEDKEESSKKNLSQDSPPATAASLLTNDLILEVLSRLPARSVCRFKCVSTPWHDLIADPAHHKRLPQTLAGFLYSTYMSGGALSCRFASVSDGAFPVDPSLHFMQPNKYRHIALEDTCNGLILCTGFYTKETPATDKDEYPYVVCNPATGRWIELPPLYQAEANIFYSTTCLAFDPAVSSHFHVLQFSGTILGDGSRVTGVDIFSSQTGAWIHRDGGLTEKITMFYGYRGVFFGGMLHLVGYLNSIYALLVVDMEGKVRDTLRLPDASSECSIGLSQGCFYYASTTRAHVSNINKKTIFRAAEIRLWSLENYDTKEWVLKHSANIDESLGITGVQWRVFAIHPDCDTVFLASSGAVVLASYDVQHQKFSHILTVEKDSLPIYFPYVPLFSEALADADGQ